MTAKYQERDPFASEAFKSLKQFVESAGAVDGEASFEEFERELHHRMLAFEADIAARQLEQYDVEVEEIEVFGGDLPPQGQLREEVLRSVGRIGGESSDLRTTWRRW
jgi:hypothetical protein